MKFGESVGSAGEKVARFIGRRDLLGRVLKGTAVVFAGAAVGSLTGVGKAFAASCSSPSCGPTRCAGTYLLPVGVYCPSGKVICKKANCSTRCPYTNGTWVACTGTGRCGQGYWLCADCRTSGGCSGICQQLSGVYCSGCCFASEVKEEWEKHQAALAAA